MENNDPNLQLSMLQAGAISAHESMISFVEAGFTRAEALQLVIAMLIEAMRQSNKPDAA